MSSATRDVLWIVAAIIAIALVAYAGPVFGGVTFVGRDHFIGTLPAEQYLAEALRAGRLPHWCSAVDLGVAFAGNPNHSTLYPPMWLTAALPLPWSIDFVIVLHVAFAGIGAALFSRRLGAERVGAIVAGSAFMLGGFTSSVVLTGGGLIGLVWMPWVAFGADRLAGETDRRARARQMLLLAGLFAGALISGDPSFAIVDGVLVLGIVLCRAERRVASLVSAACAQLLAVALAAIVVVPSFMLAMSSSRAGGISHDKATAWSMHPLRMLEWMWPDALGDPNQATQHIARAVADSSGSMQLSPGWAVSMYISIPVIVLAALGWLHSKRDSRRLGLLVVVLVLIALGRYTPLYQLYRSIVLPEHFVRYPEKYFAGVLLLVSASAGVGWPMLVARWRAALVVTASLSAVIGIGIIIMPALLQGMETSTLAPALDVEAGVVHAREAGLVALAVIAAMVASVWLARRRGVVLNLAPIILVGHLISRTWHVLPTLDRDVIKRPPLILRDITTPHRIAHPMQHRVRPDDPLPQQARTLYEGAVPNVATPFGHTYLLGYDQGHSGIFDKWQASVRESGDRGHDVYGVELAIIDADETGGRAVLATDAPYGPYALVRNEGQRPRAFVTTSWRWQSDDAMAARELFSTRSDLATVRLHGSGADGTSPAAPLVPCTIEEPRPEHVVLTCNSPSPGYAVLLDAWANGWSAQVDGKPAVIERADLIVRAVRIDAGQHRITFDYSTPGLRAGAIVSLLAWLLLLAGVVVSVRRARAARQAPSSSGS